MRADGPRPTIIGSDAGPEAPFPLRMKGKVVSGFGRGSKDLGIPTANIPVDGVPWIESAESGVYFGWAGVQLSSKEPITPESAAIVPQKAAKAGWRQFPMVMSIGYNPFYKNTIRSAEVHILHKFENDFYGSEMAMVILGFIRPEYDYVSVESLIEDINTDIEVTKKSLDREKWKEALKDPYLWGEEESKL